MSSVVHSGIWSEDFRPNSIKDCILPPRLMNPLSEIVEQGAGNFPHIIFAGPPGSGKTTSAIALAKDIGASYIKINGSDENGIDVLRGKVRSFASTTSLTSDCPIKIVIFDEADHLNATSTQPALRGFIDEFSNTCRFIFTCNYKERILSPVTSRVASLSFVFTKEESDAMKPQAFARLSKMLLDLGIEFNPKALAGVVQKYFPDLRQTITVLQSYALESGGKIDTGILSLCSKNKVTELFALLKEKSFSSVRKLIAETPELINAEFYTAMYGALSTHLKASSVPAAILILADYQDKSCRPCNQEIVSTACAIEIMKDCEFL
jgi:DNA polymerase III delta prime subunit